MWEASYSTQAGVDADEPSSGTPVEHLTAEEKGQRAAALRYVREIIGAHIVGDVGHDYTVHLAGSARPRPIPKGTPIGGNHLSIWIEQQRVERQEAAAVDDAPPAAP